LFSTIETSTNLYFMSNRGQSYRDLNAAIVKIGGVPCQDIPDIFFPEDFPDKQTREYAIRNRESVV
jgi:hypothetical protein